MPAFYTNNDRETVLQLPNGKQLQDASVKDALLPGYTWPSAKSLLYCEDIDGYGPRKRPSSEFIEAARLALTEANS